LDLCAQLIAMETVSTRCVVCVGFDHARLGGRTDLTAEIAFYPAAEARQRVGVDDIAEAGPIALLPAESAERFPSGDDTVVAVIDLGITNPATAVAIGAANCEALVAVVNAGLNRPKWQPMRGHVLHADGWSPSFASFGRSDQSPPLGWQADPTGPRLESLGRQLGSHLPVTAPLLTSVVDAARRLLSARNEALDPASRLLLTVGVAEVATGWADAPATPWNSFDAAWAEEALRGDIFKIAARALWPPVTPREVQDEDELNRVRAKMTENLAGTTNELNLQAVCENLPALVALYPVGTGVGRQLATLQGELASGPILAQHLVRRSAEYQLLCARGLRCRNAAAHGGPLTSETVATVLQWAKVLASTLHKVGLEAVMAGSGDLRAVISREHRRIAHVALKRREALAQGASIVGTLFPEEDG